MNLQTLRNALTIRIFKGKRFITSKDSFLKSYRYLRVQVFSFCIPLPLISAKSMKSAKILFPFASMHSAAENISKHISEHIIHISAFKMVLLISAVSVRISSVIRTSRKRIA